MGTACFVTWACAFAPVAGVTVAGNVTVTALDHSAQQIRVGCDAARVQPPVFVGDVVDTIECVTVDDRRYRDRDPLLARAFALAGHAPACVTLDPFVAVVVDGA